MNQQAASERQHADVRELLPFFVNDTLSELENARVMRHVANCSSCHAELDEQQRLMALMRAAPEPPGDARSAWARLARTLDAEPPARGQSRWGRLRWGRSVWIPGLGLAAAASMVVVLTPGLLANRDSRPAEYRTLTSEAPSVTSGEAVRVVFVAEATVGDIETLLARTKLQIASGPTPRGVYTLAPAAAGIDLQHALADLRASPLVALAAPAGVASTRP